VENVAINMTSFLDSKRSCRKQDEKPPAIAILEATPGTRSQSRLTTIMDRYLGGGCSKIALVAVGVCLAGSAALSLYGQYSRNTSIFRSNIPASSKFDAQAPLEEPEDDISGFANSLIADLAPDHLPQTGKGRRPGRLVVVGDVHGMKDELEDLLSKIGFNKHDHLILAGDMVSKGPDSRGVIDLAMKLKASCVKGNHEDSVLQAVKDVKELDEESDGHHNGLKHQEGDLSLGQKRTDQIRHPSEDQTISENVENIQLQNKPGGKKYAKLARKLGKKRLEWIKRLPIILRIGKLGPMGEFVVVHAGLEPGKKLHEQNLAAVTTMRSIKHNGKPSKNRDGKPWFEVCEANLLYMMLGSDFSL